jgi:predicted dehydrogenase|tara:strand:- start:393 stop:1406 length:1014 start_codon:yes stop_codon:yes gene_type:complete
MKKEIRFVVIGCGRIGKRHIEMIGAIEGATLIATCDLKNLRELGISDHYDHYTDSKSLFNEVKDIDVVAIATPNGLHAEHALQCIKYGAHPIIEKPMSLRSVDAEKVLHEALQKGRYVFGVMQNRYSPPSKWLKEIISSEKLGEIYMVHVDCFWNRDDRYYKSGDWHGSKNLDGGTLFTQFSHFIDILYWVFGDVYPTHVDVHNFNHKESIDFEDSGMVHFNLASGGKGSLNYSTSVWGSNLESSLTVIGENGSIKIAGQYMNEVMHCNIKNYTMPKLEASNPPNNYGEYKGSAANHIYVYENVMSVLAGDSSITTNALEGLKVVDIIERIYQMSKK